MIIGRAGFVCIVTLLDRLTLISASSFQAHRLRRGSDWDAFNSDYDVVASYSSRRSDVRTYPQHRAYIYGKRFGISKVYAQFGAGGFAGGANNGQHYKVSWLSHDQGSIVYCP